MKVVPVLQEQAGDLISRPVRLNFLAPGPDSLADEVCRHKLRMLLGGLCLQSMPCFQILVPVFVFGLQRGNLRIAMLPQNIREPADGLNSGSVVVQAEDGFPQIWIFLQHPQHGMFRRTTESHIAVLLPAVRVQGEKGKQIDGGLEYIEAVAGTDPVETAPRITALYVAPVAFALGIEPPLVGMTGNAAFIESDEHGVVIHLCLIYGQFPALIDQSLLCESA